MTRTSSADPAGTAPRAPSRLGRFASRGAREAIGAVVVLLGAATAAFIAQMSLPGDRATTILNIRSGQPVPRTPEELAPINEQFGLERSPLTQYWDYMTGLLHGDLGTSYQQFRPVTDVIGDQLMPTLVLTVTAIALSWLIMVVWVTLTAGRSRRVRAAGEVTDTVSAGLPPYWLGIILLLVFALNLGWFPVIGGNGIDGLLLPALALAIPLAGFMGQATRAEFERALDQPFVISARMRGMSDLGVRLRHVLRHAVLPAITLSGWALGATLSSAVVVEAVFTRQGIGSVLVTAVNTQDLPVVTGLVVLIALLYVIANLLVDVVYRLVDPRLGVS